MLQDRMLDRMDIETSWLFTEGSINFWLHVIFAAALLGVLLFRPQNIKYGIAYRLAVISFAFGWLLPVLTQWMLLSITITFVDNMRRAGPPPRELMFILPWAYVLGVCFKGVSVILFVSAMSFGRPATEKDRDPGRSIALDDH